MTRHETLAVIVAALAMTLVSCRPEDRIADFERPPEAAYEVSRSQLEVGDLRERVQVARVTEDFFAIIDHSPMLGRSFILQDFAPGAEPAVLLGYRWWTDRLDGDPAIVGTTIRLDGRAYTVLGVMQEGVEWPLGAQHWVLQPAPEHLEAPRNP